MNQPSVFFCVVPVLPATSARTPKRAPHRLPGAEIDGAAHHVDQIAHRLVGHHDLTFRFEIGEHATVFVGNAGDKNRLAVLAAGGDSAVGGDHLQQRHRTSAERERGHSSSLLWLTPMRRASSAVFLGPISCMTCAVIVFFE